MHQWESRIVAKREPHGDRLAGEAAVEPQLRAVARPLQAAVLISAASTAITTPTSKRQYSSVVSPLSPRSASGIGPVCWKTWRAT